MEKTFVEICIFQVKPNKTEEFEAILNNLIDFQRKEAGVIDVRYMKRTHRFTDFSGIKNGEPSKRIERIIKSVKYIMYWELENELVHGKATQAFFEKFDKEISRCLIAPADKHLGERLY